MMVSYKQQHSALLLRYTSSSKHFTNCKFRLPPRPTLVFALRNNPFRLATVCLGVLGVVLLFVVIGQSVHCESLVFTHTHIFKMFEPVMA